jgi:hypothetical protein
MERVNTFRKDQVYKDEAAAKAKHGNSKKKHLPIHHLSITLSMVQTVTDIGFIAHGAPVGRLYRLPDSLVP